MNSGTKPFAVYDRTGIIVASSIIFGLAGVTWGTLPFLIGSFTDALSLSPQQGGFLGTIEQAGLVTGTLVVYFARSRANWHTLLLIGAVVALAANEFSLAAKSAEQLFPIRYTVGVGLGIAMALTMYFLGKTSNPDRSYGIMMAIQIAIFSAFAFLCPYLINTWALAGFVHAVGICIATIMVLLWWLPKGDAAHPETVVSESVKHDAPTVSRALFGLLTLVAMSLYQIGMFALFAFLERIGSNSSLTLEFVGTAIAIGGGAGGVVGGLVASWLADRLGRVIPLTISVCASLVAVYLLQEGTSATTFFVGFTMFNIGWYFGIPYFMANIASNDPANKLVGITPTIMNLSLAAAPGLGSLFIVGGSYSSLNIGWYFGIPYFMANIASNDPANKLVGITPLQQL